MKLLHQRLPNCKIVQETEDLIEVEWNCLELLARYRPRDGRWLVVVYDLSIHDDYDMAPVSTCVADDVVEAEELIGNLAEEMILRRRRPNT